MDMANECPEKALIRNAERSNPKRMLNAVVDEFVSRIHSLLLFAKLRSRSTDDRR